MQKEINGWCVEYVTAAKGDAVNGLDIDSVEYKQVFFTNAAKAQNYARQIARMKPCPCVLGDVGIHTATYAKHGKAFEYWRVDDESEAEWIDCNPLTA